MIMNTKEIYGNLSETRCFNLGQLTVVFTEELAGELLDPKTEKIARKFLNSLRYGYIGFSHGEGMELQLSPRGITKFFQTLIDLEIQKGMDHYYN